MDRGAARRHRGQARGLTEGSDPCGHPVTVAWRVFEWPGLIRVARLAADRCSEGVAAGAGCAGEAVAAGPAAASVRSASLDSDPLAGAARLDGDSAAGLGRAGDADVEADAVAVLEAAGGPQGQAWDRLGAEVEVALGDLVGAAPVGAPGPRGSGRRGGVPGSGPSGPVVGVAMTRSGGPSVVSMRVATQTSAPRTGCAAGVGEGADDRRGLVAAGGHPPARALEARAEHRARPSREIGHCVVDADRAGLARVVGGGLGREVGGADAKLVRALAKAGRPSCRSGTAVSRCRGTGAGGSRRRPSRCIRATRDSSGWPFNSTVTERTPEPVSGALTSSTWSPRREPGSRSVPPSWTVGGVRSRRVRAMRRM